MVPNSPCQPPWLTWNFWMSTQWQLVGFYVSMTSSQKVSENAQIHRHLPGTYPAHDFLHGCANMEPISFMFV